VLSEFALMKIYWVIPALITAAWLGALMKWGRVPYGLIGGSFVFSLASVFVGIAMIGFMAPDPPPGATGFAGVRWGPLGLVGGFIALNGVAGMLWCLPLLLLTLIVAPVMEVRQRSRA
jgi:hypothetical protein